VGEIADYYEDIAITELAMSENLKTYDEWKLAGFHVVKGEKSVGKNNLGIAVFSELQVERDDF
jgi:hypothetical protein